MHKKQYKIITISPYAPLAKGFGGIAVTNGAYIAALSQITDRLYQISPTSSMTGEVSAAAMRSAYPRCRWLSYRVLGAARQGMSLAKRWGIGFGFLKYLPAILSADYIFINGALSWPSTLSAILCRLLRRPYFLICHASLDSSRMAMTQNKRGRWYTMLLPAVLFGAKGARALVVSGLQERNALPNALSNCRTVEIENFFDFDLSRHIEPPPHSGKHYLFVGRIEPDKGIRKFLNIWGRTAAADSCLTIVGSGKGEYAKQVEVAAGNFSNVRFLGEVDHTVVADLMRQSHITVLPTGLDDQVTENFGNTIVESFIVGRPVMVTKGLHWDVYASSPAIMTFARTDDSVADTIRTFDVMDEAQYEIAMRAAAELSRNFHIRVGVRKIRQMLGCVS